MGLDWTKLCFLARLRARLDKHELVFLGAIATSAASVGNLRLEQMTLSST